MIPSQNDSPSYQDSLERTRLALAETQALYQVARSLFTFPNLPSLLQTVVDTVAEALPANRVTLITFDLETRKVTNFMKGGAGAKHVLAVSFEELWDGLSGWTLRELKPALSPKDIPDARESPEVQRRRLETNCGSIIVVPLYYQSRVLGTMTAINCPDEREFTERDVELMMAMASQCAIAIENARLFEQLQSANSALEQRVAERTSKLAETNARLQAEIAERDRIAQALQTSESHYQLLVEAMNDGLAVIDEKATLTYVNRRFCDLLGYGMDELIGQPLTSFMDTSNQEILDGHIQKRRKGESSFYEIAWMTKAGHTIFTLFSDTPLIGKQGGFLGSLAVITDITDRKRAEEQERTITRGLRAVVDAADELIPIEDSNTFYRRAVELAREKLKVERCAIFVVDSTKEHLTGTYGTDKQGQTTEEHAITFTIKEQPELAKNYGSPWWIIQDGRQTTWDGTNIQTIGSGWIAVTTIHIGDEPIGIFVNDAAISNTLINLTQQESIVIYCSLLGNILKRKRAEEALRKSEEVAKEFQERLRALHEVRLELSSSQTLDDLYYRVVELGISKLSFERLGLFLFDNEQNVMRGTFGTSEDGSIRDERKSVYPIRERDRENSLVSGTERARLYENADLQGDGGVVVGKGWNAVAVLWNGYESIGFLFTDNYFSHQPPRSYLVDLLALYGSLLGNLITQKQTEANLRSSENRHRTVSELISDYAYAYDVLPDGTVTPIWMTEDSFKRTTGYEWKAVKENNYALFHPDDAGRAEQDVKRTLKGEITQGTYRMATASGAIKWIHTTRQPEWDTKENRVVRFYGVAQDITERKKAEDELRESEDHARGFQEKLKALQEISLELASVESLEQLCRRAIELGHRSLGYDRVGLLLFENVDKSRVSRFGLESTGELRVEHGMSYKPAADRVYSQLHNRDDAFVSEDAALGDFENVVGRGWNVVVGIWDASASIGWLAADNYFEKQPLIPYQIELLKLYGLTLGHLVTRQRAEESLRRYNQRLSTLHDIDRNILVASSLESIADIVLKHLVHLIPCEFSSVILHNDELTEEQVFAWNHAPDVHVLTRTIQPVVPNQVLERLKSGQSAVTADLRTQEGPLALLAEDLVTQGIHSAMANPMMVQGRLIGTLALASRQIGFFTPEHQQIGEEVADQVAIAFHQAKLHDQIERYNLELEQRVRERTTQLENANRELELFSYSVSHDLRAPLRAIQGFAEIIARRHKGDLNQEGRHYFDNIITASEQMNELITDLLGYVRLGRQHIHLTTIQLGDVISDVINNLLPLIEESGAQIHTDDLPVVLGDSTLLKRIFTNLLENALIYHRPNVAPIISIGYVLDADYSVIRVSDNGIGIPPEFSDKVFDIFQRLHSQSEYPGTGIGLAIIRKSVEMLKGSVWVEAGAKEGSVFCVKLLYRAKRDK